jgi:hypothetical protein
MSDLLDLCDELERSYPSIWRIQELAKAARSMHGALKHITAHVDDNADIAHAADCALVSRQALVEADRIAKGAL